MSTYESCFDLVPQGGLSLEEAKVLFEVIKAAEALFNVYTEEDSRQDYWKLDAVLDHRLYALFLKVEALQEARDE